MVFHGQVQGVGFRYRARHAAERFGVTGWVRNECDGSVVAELQGTETQIEQLTMSLERGSYIHIEDREVRDIPLVPDERGFRAI